MNMASPPQTATRSISVVHVPLPPSPPELLAATVADHPSPGGRRPSPPAELVRHVFTAAGEVEAAEWELDQVCADAAASGTAFGTGLDVEPVDGVLESAQWALDQAVSALHTGIRAASEHGVPDDLLAEASALDVEEIRAVLDDVADAPPTPAEEPVGALVVQELATAAVGDDPATAAVGDGDLVPAV